MKIPTVKIAALRRRGPVSLADLDAAWRKAQAELAEVEAALPALHEAVTAAEALDVDVRLAEVEESVAVEAQGAARAARQDAQERRDKLAGLVEALRLRCVQAAREESRAAIEAASEQVQAARAEVSRRETALVEAPAARAVERNRAETRQYLLERES